MAMERQFFWLKLPRILSKNILAGWPYLSDVPFQLQASDAALVPTRSGVIQDGQKYTAQLSKVFEMIRSILKNPTCVFWISEARAMVRSMCRGPGFNSPHLQVFFYTLIFFVLKLLTITVPLIFKIRKRIFKNASPISNTYNHCAVYFWLWPCSIWPCREKKFAAPLTNLLHLL